MIRTVEGSLSALLWVRAGCVLAAFLGSLGAERERSAEQVERKRREGKERRDTSCVHQ